MAGTYEQFCAVATALDVVGDRWTLLVVRELLGGPRRYRALAHDLPGIATNLLADRLRRLEAAGLLARLPDHDGRARTYQLTDAGQGLRPVIEALGRFGLPLLPDDAAGLAFRAQWLELALSLVLRRGALPDDLPVRFDVDTGDGTRTLVHLRLGPSGVAVDEDGAPDVVVRGDPAALLAVARDPARTDELTTAGRLTVTGDATSRRRLRRALTGPT
ncbi:MAG TPA: winged helix-turn-helix transcriptional regulator [Pseudonocardia sp.]|nr:winged helix-turn-helix transcriptional regulator [Pseudonocardia sp.]